MKQGVTNPCHFTQHGRLLKGLVHGDDFIFTGHLKDLEWLRQKFEDRYACKTETIGRASHLKQSARFLNRVISYGNEGLEFEADQRLVEAIIDGLGIKDSNPSTAPGTKPKPISRAEVQNMMEKRLKS